MGLGNCLPRKVPEFADRALKGWYKVGVGLAEGRSKVGTWRLNGISNCLQLGLEPYAQ